MTKETIKVSEHAMQYLMLIREASVDDNHLLAMSIAEELDMHHWAMSASERQMIRQILWQE